MEVWKDVVGYEGLYEISSEGRVRRGIHIKKPQNHSSGYLSMILYKEGIGTGYLLHRLVCLAFLENSDNKRTVNHINENKKDNNLINLEWNTDSEQHLHSPKPVGVSGHRHISAKSRTSYCVYIRRPRILDYNKTFKTLPEAIKARDNFLATL